MRIQASRSLLYQLPPVQQNRPFGSEIGTTLPPQNEESEEQLHDEKPPPPKTKTKRRKRDKGLRRFRQPTYNFSVLCFLIH